MHLGCRLAASVLCPIHAVGEKLYSGGIYGVNGSFKASWQAGIATPKPEIRVNGLQLFEYAPEKNLAMAGFLVLLACDKVFRFGGTAPRMSLSAPLWLLSASQTSLRLKACES